MKFQFIASSLLFLSSTCFADSTNTANLDCGTHPVIELVTFNTITNTQDQTLITKANTVTPELQKAKGFISRHLGKNQQGWIDIVLWQTQSDAQNAANAMMQNPIAGEFFALIDQASIQMNYYCQPLETITMSTKFGMQAVITAQQDKGNSLAELLLEASRILSTDDSCEMYSVQQSITEPEKIYISEIWKNEQAHKVSLANPAVREVITRAMPLIASMNATPTNYLGGK